MASGLSIERKLSTRIHSMPIDPGTLSSLASRYARNVALRARTPGDAVRAERQAL